MLEEFDGSEQVIEHPYLEPVELLELEERDGLAGLALEGVRHRIEEREVFQVWRDGETGEQGVEVERPLCEGERSDGG